MNDMIRHWGAAQNSEKVTVTSVGTPSPGGKLLPLNIQWGCVAPDTRVRMADGQQLPIAEVRAGDHLLADAHGRVVQVEQVISGVQSKPNQMVHLVCAGAELLATFDHPVMTVNGPLPLSKLRIGDWVLTERGQAQVERLTGEDYRGQVANLVLQPVAGAVALKGDCFIGNGLVIGDCTMQNWLAQGAIPQESQALS